MEEEVKIIKAFYQFLSDDSFPCIAAKYALVKENIQTMVAGHMACPTSDKAILDFIYKFTTNYRTKDTLFTPTEAM